MSDPNPETGHDDFWASMRRLSKLREQVDSPRRRMSRARNAVRVATDKEGEA